MYVMHIAYVDDSGTTGNNLKDHQAIFQVVAGIVLRDHQFNALEIKLALLLSLV
jgi:hypothetical protein